MPTLSFKEAAIKILRESKIPLSVSEIYAEAAKQGLVKTVGETPEASMGAQIYVDIKKNGEKSAFVKVGRGLFSAASTSNKEKAPEQIIQEYNSAQRTALKERLQNTNPYVIENLVGDLLKKLGYEDVKVTKYSGDGGIDVKANLTIYGFTNVKTVVQVKRHKQNVGDSVVRELRGAAEVGQRGLIITTSDFTKSAVEEASAPNKMPVSLVNGEKLLDLLIRYQVGITLERKEIISLNEKYFEELEGKDLGNIAEKKLSTWPLPGGIDHYYESLLNVLKALKSKPMSKASIIKWFKNTFENVNSDKTITSYMSTVFSNLGLVVYQKDSYGLTKIAEDLLVAPTKEKVYDLFKKRIFGIEETLSFVESSDEPVSESNLYGYLQENYNVGWSTSTQASFRLLWLWNLGKIKRLENGKYCAI